MVCITQYHSLAAVFDNFIIFCSCKLTHNNCLKKLTQTQRVIRKFEQSLFRFYRIPGARRMRRYDVV